MSYVLVTSAVVALAGAVFILLLTPRLLAAADSGARVRTTATRDAETLTRIATRLGRLPNAGELRTQLGRLGPGDDNWRRRRDPMRRGRARECQADVVDAPGGRRWQGGRQLVPAPLPGPRQGRRRGGGRERRRPEPWRRRGRCRRQDPAGGRAVGVAASAARRWRRDRRAAARLGVRAGTRRRAGWALRQ